MIPAGLFRIDRICDILIEFGGTVTKIRFLWVFTGIFGAVLAQASNPRTQMLNELPLRFEQNRGGDAHRGAEYTAHSPNFLLNLAPDGNWLEWSAQGNIGHVRTKLVNARTDTRLEAEDRLPGTSNYFLGDPKKWKTGVTGFGRIRYRNVYAGIDLIFRGEQGRLEYDFIVAPHADPREIRLELSGHREARIDSDGDLVIVTEAGEVRWKAPEIYQERAGARGTVSGRFVLEGGRMVRFEVAPYDDSRTLVIDPALKYSTYIGGENNEAARGIAVDAAGNVYVAGISSSPDLPTTPSAYQPNFAGRTALSIGTYSGDGFVAKFTPAGKLVYLTYLGGSRDDGIAALTVDAAGNAYVTGGTNSVDFPIVNAFQSRFGGLSGGSQFTGDAFIAKLSSDGTTLIFSTYLGGVLDDIGLGIALDAGGNIYVCGASASNNFPLKNPTQGKFAGSGGEPIRHVTDTVPEWEPGDGFVAMFDPTGAQLLFSTYLGGTLDDAALSIAVDSSNNVYVGGCTISSNFPTTSGAYQVGFGGTEVQNQFFHLGDGFVTKINPTTSTVIYSTFFGGSGDDCINGIALDSSGSVYMTGTTSSMNLPVSAGAFQVSYGGYIQLPFLVEMLFGDAFVAKLDPAGAKLQYLSYLGGSQNDGGTAIAVDGQGNAFVLGFTDSQNFPLAGSPLQSKMAGDGGIGLYLFYGDAFLAVVNPTGTKLTYSTYFGGNADERPFGMALDGNGNVYLAGNTVSTNLPTTVGALQTTYGGFKGHANGTPRGDAFYTVLSGFPTAPVIAKVANAEGESAVIAPNTWIEIKGTGLAPDTRVWQGSDFVNNQMPNSLDGVSVTLNGKSAFVYFISPGQVNVLTPPDLAAGPVQAVVTSQGNASTAFAANAQNYSTSFFIFNGGPYVVATHLNGTLIGPATLYPGSTSPAGSGETIVLYANGFGPVAPPVVSGSATQAGNLPSLPAIRIGANNATVTFAGLVSPGLYQFNVLVPVGAVSGDNTITATFNGNTTQMGTLLTIK
jgi:uncharacterized protein (TIGR03437 family)